MKLDEALHAEITHWEDQRSKATATEQASVCEAVLGALRAVAEKSGAQTVSTMAKPEADATHAASKTITEAGGAIGALGRGRGDARDL